MTFYYRFRTLNFEVSWVRFVKKSFILFLLALFSFHYTMDNEIICGERGLEEPHCIYSFLDGSDSENEHVCTNCPCMQVLFSSFSLYLNEIYISYLVSYKIIITFHFKNYKYIPFLVKPPSTFS